MAVFAVGLRRCWLGIKPLRPYFAAACFEKPLLLLERKGKPFYEGRLIIKC